MPWLRHLVLGWWVAEHLGAPGQLTGRVFERNDLDHRWLDAPRRGRPRGRPSAAGRWALAKKAVGARLDPAVRLTADC